MIKHWMACGAAAALAGAAAAGEANYQTHHFARDFDWMDGSQDGESITIRQRREAVTDVQIGSRLDSAGNLQTVVTSRSERSFYVFASTAYRF